MSGFSFGNLFGFADLTTELSQITDTWFDTPPEKEEELDAYDLQKTLNQSYRREFRFDGFSIETCRSMVALMDIDHSGKLGTREFDELTRVITYWKNIFRQYDLNGDGVMNQRELREGLKGAGYYVSNNIIDMLGQRYGSKRGLIEFDDFIHCSIKLRMMIDEFQSRDLGRKNEATFAKEEWIEINMYS